MNRLEKVLTGILFAGLITIGIGGIKDKDYLIYIGGGVTAASVFGLSFAYDFKTKREYE